MVAGPAPEILRVGEGSGGPGARDQPEARAVFDRLYRQRPVADAISVVERGGFRGSNPETRRCAIALTEHANEILLRWIRHQRASPQESFDGRRDDMPLHCGGLRRPVSLTQMLVEQRVEQPFPRPCSRGGNQRCANSLPSARVTSLPSVVCRYSEAS